MTVHAATLTRAGGRPLAQPRRASAQTVRNTLTMAYRGLLKIRRTPEQLIDVTLQPILFT